MTKVAERTITDDLEYLISKAVDPAKADYAGGHHAVRLVCIGSPAMAGCCCLSTWASRHTSVPQHWTMHSACSDVNSPRDKFWQHRPEV